jgi:hypothetical protein
MGEGTVLHNVIHTKGKKQFSLLASLRSSNIFRDDLVIQ